MPNIAIVGKSAFSTFEILRGVYDYAASAEDWNLEFFGEELNEALSAAVNWRADGFITCCDRVDHPFFALTRAKNLPLVNIGCRGNFLSVTVNQSSVAALIEKHLEGVPLTRIALLSTTDQPVLLSALAASFGEKLGTIGLKLTVAQLTSVLPTLPSQFEQWLTGSKPAVIVTADETLAVYARRILAGQNIEVPRDVAIISIGDALQCALPSLSITAILRPDREMGYQAARRIHRLLSGHTASSEAIEVDAYAIVCRNSSQESSLDLAMSRAVRFIEENATRGITVADVMAFQQTSRVTFERQFLATLGCSPGEFIRKTKLAKAKELLLSTTTSIDGIGKACGFESPAKFSSFFKRAVGISPAQFRRQQAAGDLNR